MGILACGVLSPVLSSRTLPACASDETASIRESSHFCQDDTRNVSRLSAVGSIEDSYVEYGIFQSSITLAVDANCACKTVASDSNEIAYTPVEIMAAYSVCGCTVVQSQAPLAAGIFFERNGKFSRCQKSRY